MSTDPELLDLLRRLDSRLDRIEARLERAEGLVTEARAVVALVTDSADQAATRLGEAEVDTRLRKLVEVAEVVSRPEVTAALGTLAAAAPALAKAAPMIEGAEGAVGTVADTLDSLASRMQGSGIDLDERARNLLDAAERLSSTEAVRLLQTAMGHVGVIHTLLDSAVVAPSAVGIVASAADALVETRKEPTGAAGLWAVLGALSDPDVQRAADFAIRFGRAFGRRLADQPSR